MILFIIKFFCFLKHKEFFLRFRMIEAFFWGGVTDFLVLGPEMNIGAFFYFSGFLFGGVLNVPRVLGVPAVIGGVFAAGGINSCFSGVFC